MLLDDGLKVRRQTRRPGGRGPTTSVKKVGKDGRRELQFGDNVGKDVVGISELHDEAADHTVECVFAVNENLDGRDPKSGGVIHEASKGMMGKIASFALDSGK